ncbi:cysteine protease ATG4D [Trichonephila inaurata madagascariensis]|uniref:Cysteine protease n=1 Tax=Trichonephila inaurata madagascariensis TaxID=2747483 RepID=A0A8X6YQX5_9ARAC|nr:cysteine protease ATG4D [Trichonephila inaurata madagascariensis]
MSNINPSNEHLISLPDVQSDELDSLSASGNFEVLSCDTSQNVSMTENNCFSVPENAVGSDSSTKTKNSNCFEVSTKTYIRDSEILKTFDVDDLIQSHIATDDELNFHDQDYRESNSLNFHNGENAAGKLISVKIQPISSTSHSLMKFSDGNARDCKKSNSSPFHFGQILSKKKESGSYRIQNCDEDTVENLTKNSRPFVFKKQTPPNPDDNTQQTQMKTKLKTMWNNMKYGWRVKREVNLKLDSATWLLGRCYHNKFTDSTITEDVSKELKLDLLSKIWLTYRINFPTIPGTDFMSDSGWGCMLRCGQMMMAQAFVCHFLHRDWRVSVDQPPEKKYIYKMILRWFGDSLSDHSPFSLHHLVLLGENYGRKAGDWYGPTHAAQVLRDALIQGKRDHHELRNVCMYVALDGIVFKQDVFDLCLRPSTNRLPTNCESDEILHIPTSSNSDSPHSHLTGQKNSMPCKNNQNFPSVSSYQPDTVPVWECDDSEMSFIDPCPSYSEFGPPSFSTVEPNWTSLILFVSVRLGNDKINQFYIPCLKSLLAYEHCIGIIGGRPKHALYFIGWQDDKLIHMDPHSCQPAIDVEKDDFNEKSFHSSSIRTMSFSEMDPSCAIGFYFKRKEEFDHFVEKFSEITAPMKKNLDYPVFALAEGKRVDIEEPDTPCGYARSSMSRNSKIDEDDYILL